MPTQNRLYENNDSKNVGITFISEKFFSTIDSFWVVLNSETIINPFDFVSVDNKNNIKTIGIVKELQRTFVFFDPKSNNFIYSFDNNSTANTDIQRTGITIAKIAVMANLYKSKSLDQTNSDLNSSMSNTRGNNAVLSINMPMEEGKPVVFASADEVIESLGIPEMENPIPAGIIEMTNGTYIPIFLDISYIFGPDTTHVNASGISGNIKTSYLLFLLHGAYQSLLEDGIALILFNTKEKGLLYLNDEKQNSYDMNHYEQKDLDFMNLLNLDVNKFHNIKYFLPRGKDGKPNSAYIPQNYKTYSYELADVYDKLEMLFPSETTYDPQYNISSIINYIYESWPLLNNNNTNKNNSNEVNNWTDLIHFNDYPDEIVTHKSTLLRFKGSLQRFRKPATLFVDNKTTSTYLGKEIKQLKGKDIFVIDIAMLSNLEEQAFVIGDVMKNIDEIYSLGSNISSISTPSSIDSEDKNQRHINKDKFSDNNNTYQKGYDQNNNKSEDNRPMEMKNPKYILIMIDEINRFLPHLEFHGNPMGAGTLNRSAVSEEILKTIIAGKSRHIAILSAQQFKSQVDPFLNYNTGLHVTSKLGLSELSTQPYSTIDDTTKSSISKLQKGEIVLIHSAFKHPIKITIPKITYNR
ncbi:MAG: hypothetical protein ACTHKK_00345 [Candidatus Nitrosocosmicus sp.]